MTQQGRDFREYFKKFFIFRDLLGWVGKTRQGILDDSLSLTTNQPAEELVKRHMEIRDEINAKEYEFEYANELGNRLLSKNPILQHVNTTLHNIGQSKKDLEDTWRQKDYEYKQLFEHQVFNREADRIDAITKGHEAFLEINNLGVIQF